MIHELKILPEHFWPVVNKEKLAEIRYNDRGFEIGDYLKLKEWDESKMEYTGKIVVRMVIHVADLSAFKDGYVLLSMRPLD